MEPKLRGRIVSDWRIANDYLHGVLLDPKENYRVVRPCYLTPSISLVRFFH